MRRYFVLTGLLLVMISKPARAQPGVVINLQNQSFGGDVTEDANFVYIETSTGKIKLDRLNVKKIVYAQPGGPTPVAPDSKTAGTPAAESPRSPEDLFKARGLVRSGFILILPEEQALRDAVVQLHAAKAKVAAAMAKIRESDSQIKTLNRDLKSIQDEDHDINMAIARGDKSNQLIARHNLLLDEMQKQVEKLHAAEESRGKLLASRSDYITAALDAAQKADAAVHAYDAPRADKELLAAIDTFNLTAKPKVKLGPAATFSEDLAFVAQCKTDVTSGTIPVMIDGGVPTVEVLINGEVTQTMIWDSGASDVCLSAKTAALLGLHPGESDPTVEITIADGSKVKEHVMMLDSIRIGSFTVENVSCIVPPKGVAGADLLGNVFQRHFQFRLDVNNKTLQLSPLDGVAGTPKKSPLAGTSNRPVTDLLNGFSINDQAVSGKWNLRNGALFSDLGEFSRVDLDYQPPKEYDCRVVFSRLEGNDGFDLILCSNGRQFSLTLGGWENKICGFGAVLGKGANENPTRVSGRSLETGKTYTVIAKIRASQISAYLNGELLTQWQTDSRDLGRPEVALHRPDTIGISTFKTGFVISAIEVVDITGRGTKVGLTDPIRAKRLGTISYELPGENKTVTLYDNGHFESPTSADHRWYVRGDELVFQWGHFIDQFKLSADARTFTGQNQKGNTLRGEFLTGSLSGDPIASAKQALPPALQHASDRTVPGGAVLYLPFDKSDAAGNQIHDRSSAHLVLPATGVTTHLDAANPALGMADFDGSSWIDARQLGDFPTSKGFTYAAWFKATDSGKNGPIIDNSDWKDWTHRGAVIRIEDGHPNFTLGANDWIGLKASAAVIPDKWCHLAGTFDGSVMRLYVNGVEEGSERLHSSFKPGKYPIEIGRSTYDNNRTFTGSLAQVLIFNRALSAEEVAKLAGLKK
jgi:aspartyl protease family protein